MLLVPAVAEDPEPGEAAGPPPPSNRPDACVPSAGHSAGTPAPTTTCTPSSRTGWPPTCSPWPTEPNAPRGYAGEPHRRHGVGRDRADHGQGAPRGASPPAAPGPAVMLDTPFAFQMNRDELVTAPAPTSHRASARLTSSCSGRWSGTEGPAQEEKSLALLDRAAWAFAGPGSPTYALRQWRGTPGPGGLAGVVRRAAARRPRQRRRRHPRHPRGAGLRDLQGRRATRSGSRASTCSAS